MQYNGGNVGPVHILLSGSGGTGKSHFVKLIYKAISKTLRYHYKDPENRKFFYLVLQEY